VATCAVDRAMHAAESDIHGRALMRRGRELGSGGGTKGRETHAQEQASRGRFDFRLSRPCRLQPLA
jgi:hypothetical protein